MMNRLLMAIFVVVTLLGTAALTLTGCDDDTGCTGANCGADLSVDLSTSHDLRPEHD